MRTGLIRRPALVALSMAMLSPPAGAALMQSFHGTGHYGVEVAAVGFASAPTVSSTPGTTLNLAALPPSANPLRAFLYAMDTNHPGAMSASFNGQPLLGGAPIGPYAFDAAFSTLYTFRWDVTMMLIPGVTNYSWAFAEAPDVFGNSGGNIGMAALAVIYSDPALPLATATLYDGMSYLGNPPPDTDAISIPGLPAGTTTLHMVTYLDDNFTPPGSSGELIKFNGQTVGGPLDGNLALNGSLTTLTGTAAAGNNAVSITTPLDEFGWVVNATLTVVPLPPAALLCVPGLIALACSRRRSVRQTVG